MWVDVNISDLFDEDMLGDFVSTDQISGFVTGPASSENDQLAMFDGVTGELLKAGQTITQYLDAFLVTLYNFFPRKISVWADIATTPVVGAGQIFTLAQHTSGGIGGGKLMSFAGSVVDDGGTQKNSATSGFYLKRIDFENITPEHFGAGPSLDISDDGPTRKALIHPLPCRLSRHYHLSSVVSPPDGKVIHGINKQSTGLIATSNFSIPGAASSVLEVVSNCNYSNFTVDANNANGGGSKRLNCCPVGPNVKNFHVSDVDVYNSTGYGHVTFGSESDPQVTGYYENCHGYNCQVPFEQIGALDVTLVKCTAEGVAGRTLELFHPYGGSKNVTYISCRAWGESGAGINILTTNGHPVGPIRFIDSSMIS